MTVTSHFLQCGTEITIGANSTVIFEYNSVDDNGGGSGEIYIKNGRVCYLEWTCII